MKYFYFVIVFLPLCLNAQFSIERGHVKIENYGAKEYGGVPQIWDITEDDRGVLYFANNDGVLEFDGINWNLIRIDDLSQVRSFVKSVDGRIYVGGGR
jgi:hypothetical protein